MAHERGAEYIQARATYVEQKMQARIQASYLPLTLRLALMMALEIADELFEHGAAPGRAQECPGPLL